MIATHVSVNASHVDFAKRTRCGVVSVPPLIPNYIVFEWPPRVIEIILDVDRPQDTRDISRQPLCDARKVRVLTVSGNVSGTKVLTNTKLPPYRDSVTSVTTEMN